MINIMSLGQHNIRQFENNRKFRMATLSSVSTGRMSCKIGRWSTAVVDVEEQLMPHWLINACWRGLKSIYAAHVVAIRPPMIPRFICTISPKSIGRRLAAAAWRGAVEKCVLAVLATVVRAHVVQEGSLRFEEHFQLKWSTCHKNNFRPLRSFFPKPLPSKNPTVDIKRRWTKAKHWTILSFFFSGFAFSSYRSTIENKHLEINVREWAQSSDGSVESN